MTNADPPLVGFRHLTPVIGCVFMEGVAEDGEPIIVIANETIDRTSGFPIEGVSKEVLERFHLESYRSDHVLIRGVAPFETVERGNDPPDFVVSTEGRTWTTDCVALADTHRRLAHRLFAHFRERLLTSAGDRDFTGLGGGLVSVWFGEHLQELPPARWDDSVINPLLDDLAAARIDHAAVARLQLEVAERGFPEVLPPVFATGRVGDGDAGYVVNVVAPAGTVFPSGLPFEVQLHRPRELTRSDAQARIVELVASHDKPEIDHVLITAGGPDRDGWRYPSEEALAAFALTGLSIEVSHLKRVTLHSWFARTISEIPFRRR